MDAQPAEGTGSPQAQFAEDLSLFFEAFMPRMAGRLLGVMLCAEEPYLSAADLAERVSTSAGSVSIAIRQLEQLGLVERVVRPGIRRDLFRITEHPWRVNTDDGTRRMSALVEVLGHAIEDFGADAGSRAGDRLREMRGYYQFMIEALPRVAAEYEKTLRRNPRSRPRRT